MNETVLLYSLLYLFGVFISAVSQVLLKKAAQKEYNSIIKEYLNFPVIVAYLIFFAATLFSILAYKGIPLSLGPVLEASSYVFVTFFGVKIFGEKLNCKKLIALVLILGGIVIYSVLG